VETDGIYGWVLVTVRFLNGSPGIFRVPWDEEEYEPSPDSEHFMVFAGEDSPANETIYFVGQRLDTSTSKWTELCSLKIPGSAYQMVSWGYYAKDHAAWNQLPPWIPQEQKTP